MRRSYMVRVTTHVRDMNDENFREFHVNTLLPCFSLQDAHEMCARIACDRYEEGIRRSCEIVIKVYLDGRTHYVLVNQLRSLAEQFSGYYTEYTEDRGEDTQHDPIVNARIART